MSVCMSRRLPLIDLLKVVASQLIVLHHLAFYGPMTDHAAQLMPQLMAWLADPARMVVQVFLVVGGYLAALSLAPNGQARAPARVASRLFERYLRLALPLALALLLAIAAAAVARHWMSHTSIPSAPHPTQFFWHLLLAQDLIGEEALSAGIWYISIDLQLYAVLLLWLAAATTVFKRVESIRRVLPWGVAAGVAWSALSVNRDATWDVYAAYFLAAHGLGALAAWARSSHSARVAFVVALISVMLGLWLEWRGRLALALVLAVLLWAWHALQGQPAAVRDARRSVRLDVQHYLAQISYAIFLVHFPVCLVVNAAFMAFVPPEAGWQAVGVLLAWGGSVGAGALFHHYAEAPLMRQVSRYKAAGWGLGRRQPGVVSG